VYQELKENFQTIIGFERKIANSYKPLQQRNLPIKNKTRRSGFQKKGRNLKLNILPD
jgi:hypothetical protein